MVDYAVKTEPSAREKAYLKPKYEVRNTDNAYYVDVYMPGVSRDQAKVTLDGDNLVVEAERAPLGEEGWKAIHHEIRELGYKLHLQLNVDIEGEGIVAKADAGILTVTLPVASKAAQRSIPIS